VAKRRSRPGQVSKKTARRPPARRAAKTPRRAAKAPKRRRTRTTPVSVDLPNNPAAISRSSTYADAVTLYERGVEALQRHDYAAAARLLQGVIERYPEERELHERVRLYLKVCERQTGGPAPGPRTLEERLNAATVALNAGEYGRASEYLRAVHQEDPENDYAQYMLAVVHSATGNGEAAVQHLRRAIELNPENRALARHDPDFEAVRHQDAFRQALETAAGPTQRRRSRSRAN
jgi:tetratricopeptide (TPR) repeat protein